MKQRGIEKGVIVSMLWTTKLDVKVYIMIR